ncbi:MAG: HAMP domain-containing histidine kinase [Eubacterium sp.]|nr:HAMP domain-containing histidine kinase [Eubacterium sp.]
MFNRKEYIILNKMLDDAISGDFQESQFDESELSKLQTKLMRYLSSSSMSEQKLQEEKIRIEELITNISHQTKTPLTNIMMYSELLSEQVKDGPAKDYADEISLQSKKLSELIQALVKMSRLETGIFTFQKEEASLMQVVRNVAGQETSIAKSKNIKLTVIDEHDVNVLIDAKWVTEAVGNIVNNAIKYSGEGTEITLSVFSYEMFSGIRVMDQGIGIPEEEIPKIFSRFYRGIDVHDKEGIGVGLWLARQIVEDHGGYIKVNSKVGQGSTFDICFPNMSKL